MHPLADHMLVIYVPYVAMNECSHHSSLWAKENETNTGQMFEKLKKKIHQSGGYDLHKLANSVSNATASLAGTLSGTSSVKSHESCTQSQSTTNPESLSGATTANDSGNADNIEAKWRQRVSDMDMEWRAKIMLKDREREELVGQQKEQSLLEEELANRDTLVSVLQDRLRVERESASLQLEKQGQESDQCLHEIEQLRRNLKETENLLKTEHAEQEALWRQQTEAMQAELWQLKCQLESVCQELTAEKSCSRDFSTKVAQVIEEKNCFVVRYAQLSQQLFLCQQQVDKWQKEVDQLNCQVNELRRENERAKLLLSDQEARDERSQRMCKLRSDLSELEAVVSEKNKTIKLQQHRLADMKKVMHKELKSQQVVNDSSTCSATKNFKVGGAVSSTGSDAEDVNSKYLKHVVLKFITSRQHEAQHLTRVVSALLKLTPEEDRLLQETIEWKMSWFLPKPDMGTGQNAMYIPPS